MHFSRLFWAFACVSGLVACGSRDGDPSSAKPAELGAHIRDIADPSLPTHPKHLDQVQVSGAVVVAIDTYDETANGKSSGTIYVQDIGSQEPYSGISLFAPVYDPPSLRVGPGDTLLLAGQYQENPNIGTAKFAPGAVLPQISRPSAELQYEATSPEPRDIDTADLASFGTGRQWLGMLVRVHDVELFTADTRSGRFSAALTNPTGASTSCDSSDQPPALVNELVDLSKATPALEVGTKLRSVTGVVTFFCNLHIAPRSLDDIER